MARKVRKVGGPESSLSEKQLVNKVPQCEVSDRSEAPDVTLRPQSKVKTSQFTKGKGLFHQGRNKTSDSRLS